MASFTIFISTLCALAFIARAQRESAGGDASKCLTRFQRNPDVFKICTTRICFLFIHEDPYIKLDPSMTDESDQVLFPCNAPTSRFPLLRGSIFPVHNATSYSEAQCVWAGSDCSFNDLTAFLTVHFKRHPKHQFAATGLLVESPNRVTESLFPSSSILDDQLVIVGPLDEAAEGMATVRLLLRPFTRGAWILFWMMVILFLALGFLIVLVYTPGPVRWYLVFFHIVGESVHDLTPSQHPAATSQSTAASLTASENLSCPAPNQLTDEKRNSYRSALWLFRAGLSIFLLAFILFYEIAVVNFMFAQNTKPTAKNVARLNAKQLAHYSVLKESALEDVWKKTVDPYQLYNVSSYPWYRCITNEDCFDKVLDKRHRVKFFVTFESFGQYQILKRSKCHRLTSYKTERKLYSFGAGWLFGGRVPPSTRRSIDKDILRLRVTGQLREIFRKHAGNNGKVTCPKRPSNIGAPIVALALFVLVGPSLLLLTSVLLVAGWKNRSKISSNDDRNWGNRDDDDDDL